MDLKIKTKTRIKISNNLYKTRAESRDMRTERRKGGVKGEKYEL